MSPLGVSATLRSYINSLRCEKMDQEEIVPSPSEISESPSTTDRSLSGPTTTTSEPSLAGPSTPMLTALPGPSTSAPNLLGPSIPIANISTVNENWRGKNDPAERRRIQNRLNQRAFRQRQRSGDTARTYRPRSSSGPSQTQGTRPRRRQRESSVSGSESTTSVAARSEPRAASAPASAPASDAPVGVPDSQTGLVWDELGRLINRNFMSAAVTNAAHVAISPLALQEGTPMVLTAILSTETTSSDTAMNIPTPASLRPVDLQYRIPHDPIVDIIPHARLRHNILRAVASGRFDPTPLYRCLRETGALERVVNGSWQRRGVVVWAAPEELAGWELSESFVVRWNWLLEGCGDLLEVADGWRRRRGERGLSLPGPG